MRFKCCCSSFCDACMWECPSQTCQAGPSRNFHVTLGPTLPMFPALDQHPLLTPTPSVRIVTTCITGRPSCAFRPLWTSPRIIRAFLRRSTESSKHGSGSGDPQPASAAILLTFTAFHFGFPFRARQRFDVICEAEETNAKVTLLTRSTPIRRARGRRREGREGSRLVFSAPRSPSASRAGRPSYEGPIVRWPYIHPSG